MQSSDSQKVTIIEESWLEHNYHSVIAIIQIFFCPHIFTSICSPRTILLFLLVTRIYTEGKGIQYHSKKYACSVFDLSNANTLTSSFAGSLSTEKQV